MTNWLRLAAAGCLGVVLAACGGGGGSSPPTGTTTTTTPAPSDAPRIEAYDSPSKRLVAKAGGPGFELAPKAASVQLGPVAVSVLPAPKALAAGGMPPLQQIGEGRALADTADTASTARLLSWQPLADGRLAAAVNFRSQGAASLRLGLRVDQLPASATVRVSAPDGTDSASLGGAQILATLARNAKAGAQGDAARLFWLPTVSGQDARLQIELPAGTDPAGVQLAVPRLVHQWVDLAQGKDSFLKVGEAAACNVDASCQPDYSGEARAVARMEFVSGGQGYLCTGTLMADVKASGTPWFLSANHCISDQASASSLVTYWFYQSASCNSSIVDPRAVRVSGGATLLYASDVTDTSFMQLDSAPPGGVRYAGSLLVAPSAGSEVAGLHHPSGDLLKFSRGTIQKYAGCAVDSQGQLGCGQSGDNFAAVLWNQGTTESGSSGSAMFTGLGSGHYVSGHLFAGLASCLRQDQPDYYGRFDVPYRAALYQWLGNVPGAR